MHQYRISHRVNGICVECGYGLFENSEHSNPRVDKDMRYGAEALWNRDQNGRREAVTPLEHKVVDRFREHGNRLLATLPDWANSEFLIGDENQVAGHWLKKEDGKVAYPKVYRHRFALSLDKILAAHTLLGQETLGIAIVVEAEIAAERKQDGIVYSIQGIRRWYDQAGWSLAFGIRTHDGHFLLNRKTLGWEKSTAEVRKARRAYEAMVPAGMDWDSDAVARDPAPEDNSLDGTRFSHIKRVRSATGMIRLAFVRDQVEVEQIAQQASDGRWLLSTWSRVYDRKRLYEEGLRTAEAPLVKHDPEAHLLTLF